MRELKFRFWNKIVGRMTNKNYSLVELHDQDVNFNLLIPMQFTGLIDKNGVEIYEGDICRTTYYNYVEKNAVFNQVVVFENGTFAVKSIDKETSAIDEWRSFSSLHQFFVPTPNKIEIIGNIHENPELLTKTN